MLSKMFQFFEAVALQKPWRCKGRAFAKPALHDDCSATMADARYNVPVPFEWAVV